MINLCGVESRLVSRRINIVLPHATQSSILSRNHTSRGMILSGQVEADCVGDLKPPDILLGSTIV
jgi:hypothetical protein